MSFSGFPEIGMEKTFTFPVYISLIPLIIAAVPLVIGLFVLRRNRGAALLLFAVALGIAVLFGPMLFHDRVVVTKEELTQTTGFWFAPTVKGFRFSETKAVTITTEIERRGIRNDIWTIHKKDGTTECIDPGDLWETNTDEIVPILKKHGIEVERR